MFSRGTNEVTKEQLKKAQHVADVDDAASYQKAPPRPNSTHGLSSWLSIRPESFLEKFHEFLAHFGNTFDE